MLLSIQSENSLVLTFAKIAVAPAAESLHFSHSALTVPGTVRLAQVSRGCCSSNTGFPESRRPSPSSRAKRKSPRSIIGGPVEEKVFQDRTRHGSFYWLFSPEPFFQFFYLLY